jgi:integrase
MPKAEFSTKWIEAQLRKPRIGQVDYIDSAHRGLSLRISPRAAGWYLVKRIAGQLMRVKLGEWPQMSLADARAEYAKQMDAAERGQSPRMVVAAQRAERAAAVVAHDARAVKLVGPKWLDAHKSGTKRRSRPLSASAARDYARHLAQFVATFGERDICTIRRTELQNYIDDRSTPAERNRAWTMLNRLFAFAAGRFDAMESNPTTAIERPAGQAVRERVLSRAEIRTLWRACELAGYPYGDTLMLALLTGQRVGEVGTIRRADIDGPWWVQRHNKAQRRTDVFLGPLAMGLVARAPKHEHGDYLFSAKAGRTGVRSDVWSLAIQRHIAPALATAVAEGHPPITTHWTRHDLRRTVSTGLREWCAVPHDDVERVLNHAIGGLRKHYDHASYRAAMQNALARWDAEIQAIIDPGTADGSVVALKGRKRKRAAG